MAEQVFHDLLKVQIEGNNLTREQMAADGKPDPKKFIKEEAISIFLNRKYQKDSIKLGQKAEKGRVQTVKTEQQRDKKDTGYYKGQLKQQEATSKELQTIEKDTVEGNEESSDQRSNMRIALDKIAHYAEVTYEGVQKAWNSEKATKAKEKLTKAKDKQPWKAIGKIFTGKFGLNNMMRGLWKGITGLAGAVKEGAKKGWGFIKKLLIGGAILGLIDFLGGKNWEKVANWIHTVALPALANFVDKVLKPLWEPL